MEERKLASLLGSLYPADSARTAWEDFTRDLSTALGGAFCAVWEARAVAHPLGISPAGFRRRLLRAYETDGDRHEPLLERSHPIGQVVASRAWPDGGRWLRDALGSAADGSEGLLLPLVGDGEQVRSALVAFPLDGRTIPEGGPRLLERLAPFLSHAVRCERQRRLVASRVELHRWMANHLRFGVLFLDADGRILFANRTATSMLEGHEASDFFGHDVSEERREKLARALEGLRAPRCGPEAEPAPLRVMCFPLAAGRDGARPKPERTAVLITRREDPETVSEDWMRERFALTPAEARLASLLAADRSLEEAAEELGLTIGTVRTRLKSIFAKTDTHRQASLVRLLLAEPAPPMEL